MLASLGPYPLSPRSTGWGGEKETAHWVATAFQADSLLAWIALAALLLIPFEARTPTLSIRAAVARGVLWGSVLSLGAMTKLNFFYFILFIVPTLFLIRLRIDGVRRAWVTIVAFACSSVPAAFYLVRWGRPAFANAYASSFGGFADHWYVPMLQFLTHVIRGSPGLVFSLALIISALIYLVIKKRALLWGPDLFALLITISFGAIVLASHNREIRFAFPTIVALPFLTGIFCPATDARFLASLQLSPQASPSLVFWRAVYSRGNGSINKVS